MDYKNLKDAIKDVIKKNGEQEITGQIMQDTLLSIVSKLGGNKTFAGVARPTTVPDTTDANIFYIAGENGTYVNFGGAKVENEAAVFVQVSGGTWRAIYTGIQTSHGVNNQLQQEHEYFETEIDKVSADLTQFKQTEFTDVKEDVAGNATEIAKINGEIATLNIATNTAADELVRIEGKVDANLKDAVVVFVPSTNTGVYKGADILSFTNDTPTSTVTAYMSQYWDKLVKLASGKISGSVYAESNNANCTGGSCIGGTQFGYLKIEIEDYQKGGVAGEVLVLSFDSGTERKEMTVSKKSERISVAVEEYKNVVGINNTLYEQVRYVDDGYWTTNNSFTLSKSYECAIVYLSGIKKISAHYEWYGNSFARVLKNDYTLLKEYKNNEGKPTELNIDVEALKGGFYLLISSYKGNGTKMKINIKEDDSMANQINKASFFASTLEPTDLEFSSCYAEDGSINKNKPGYIRAVYPIRAIDRLLFSISSEEGVAFLVGIPEEGESVVIRKGAYKGTVEYSSDRRFSRIGISTKEEYFKKVVVTKPRGCIYNLLHGLIGDKRTLSLYGDALINEPFGEEISPNDEYAPSNEVQTLENKPRYKNFAYYLAKRNKLRWYDFAFEKATLTDCKTKAAPDLNCILTDDAIISMTDQKPDYITLWYGVNDAQFNPIMQRELWLKDKYKAAIAYPMQESEIGKDGYATAEQKAEVDKAVGRVGEVEYDNADSYFFAKFVGTENDEELTTWCGALNYAFPLLMSEYPDAKIMIICPDHEKHGKLIREATIKMAEKWGVLYFDLNSLPYWYGSEKTKFENTDHRYSYDGVRPSELGHKVISFPIGNKLING